MRPYLFIKHGALGQLFFSLEDNGRQLSPHSSNYPIAIRQLARVIGSMGAIEDELVRSLQDWESPLMVKVDQFPNQRFQWSNAIKASQRWTCEILPDRLAIAQTMVDPAIPNPLHPIGKRFVVSLEQSIIGLVEPTKQSTELDHYLSRWATNWGDDGSTQEYLKNPIRLPQHLISQLTCIPPVQLQSPEWVLSLRLDDDGTYIATPALRCGQLIVPILSSWAGDWGDVLDYPSAIGSLSWIKTILDTCIATLTHSPAPPLPDITYQAQPELFHQKVSDLMTFATTTTSILLPNNGWVQLSITGQDYLQLLRLILSAGAVIQGQTFFLDDDPFQQLISLASQHTPPISIVFNQKPVDIQELSFVVEMPSLADGGGEPMVRMGDTLFRLDEWMAPPSFQESEHGTTILSPDTIMAIQAILQLQNRQKRSDRRHVMDALGHRLRLIDLMILKRHQVRVILSDDDRQLLEKLESFTAIDPVSIPTSFTGQLRPYQADAVAWLTFLYDAQFGACLADDMGLGKTVQVIAFLATILERNPDCGPMMMVLPPSLVHNWALELAKFLPSVSVLEYIGSDRLEMDWAPGTIILATYDVIRRDIDSVALIPLEVIVFDEAQLIKNKLSNRSLAIRRLKSRFRICLTGTPIENRLDDFLAILDTALPGFLYFLTGVGASESLAIQYARPFVLRRTKETIESELPPKIESEVVLPLDSIQRAMYMNILSEVRETIRQSFEEHTPQRAGILAITAILRLRQVCLAPQLIDSMVTEPSPKTRFLIEQLVQLKDEGHSVLVFSQFRSYLELLYPLLLEAGLDVIQIDGTTSMTRRRQRLQYFQETHTPVVALMTLKTGGMGLNLVKASYVYHMDPWWNPSVELQASDRAHRIGQRNRVNVIRLLMQDSIEEKIGLLKAEKQALFNRVLNQGMASKNRVLQREDFEWLLS